MQLEGVKALVGNDVRWQPHTAQLLKHCIERQVQVRPSIERCLCFRGCGKEAEVSILFSKFVTTFTAGFSSL